MRCASVLVEKTYWFLYRLLHIECEMYEIADAVLERSHLTVEMLQHEYSGRGQTAASPSVEVIVLMHCQLSNFGLVRLTIVDGD